jgi:hypothetical protein
MPEPYFRLNLQGMEEHARLAGRDADWFHPHGHLRWAFAGPDSEDLFRGLRRMSDLRYPVRVAGRDEALRLEPDLPLPPVDSRRKCRRSSVVLRPPTSRHDHRTSAAERPAPGADSGDPQISSLSFDAPDDV